MLLILLMLLMLLMPFDAVRCGAGPKLDLAGLQLRRCEVDDELDSDTT